MNWDSLIKSFSTYLRIERSLSTNTIESYSNDLNKLADFLTPKSIPATKVRLNDLKDFITSISDILSDTSQSRIISAIKSFYKFLLIENLIQSDPSENLVSPKIGRKLPNVLSIEEINLIINSVESNKVGIRNKAIIEIIYGCGLRVSELTNLLLSNLFLKQGYIKIVGKGNKERLSPIGSLATDSLNDFLTNVRPGLKINNKFSDHVFINNRGTSLSRSMIFKMIKKYTLKANINKDISPHSLRHSFATHLVDGGANLIEIQKLLGHSDISTTEIYVHLSKEFIDSEYMKAFDKKKN